MQLVRDTTRDILFHDGSDVGMEQQVLEISKNQYLHNMAITIMGTQFRMLQTAISEPRIKEELSNDYSHGH